VSSISRHPDFVSRTLTVADEMDRENKQGRSMMSEMWSTFWHITLASRLCTGLYQSGRKESGPPKRCKKSSMAGGTARLGVPGVVSLTMSLYSRDQRGIGMRTSHWIFIPGGWVLPSVDQARLW
jgi:hypothetical protein